MTWNVLLAVLALVGGAFSFDSLEGTIKYVFHPGGGQKLITLPPGGLPGTRIALTVKHLSLAPGESFKIFDGQCNDSPVLTSQVWSKEALYREVIGTTFESKGNVACVQFRAGSIPGAVEVYYKAIQSRG
ncbi:uncharacterized protein LOC135483212 [Lineus longissimus]|uniref:uncharacterized protein LOC135483212 n=1 Tax=Lineus longissimus TaxID=88925 RepID=UPI00315DAB46